MSTPPDRPPTPPRRGRRGLRILLGLVVAVVIVFLLFTVVFPWFQEYTDDPTLEAAPAPMVATAEVG